MHAFEVLGDAVRRRILDLLADGERPAGELGAVVQAEFGISQPAVSLHLRVLRERGFATVRPAGARRLYAIDPEPFHEIDTWLDRYRASWTGPVDSRGTATIGKHGRGLKAAQPSTAGHSAREKKHKKRAKRKERKHETGSTPGARA